MFFLDEHKVPCYNYIRFKEPPGTPIERDDPRPLVVRAKSLAPAIRGLFLCPKRLILLTYLVSKIQFNLFNRPQPTE